MNYVPVGANRIRTNNRFAPTQIRTNNIRPNQIQHNRIQPKNISPMKTGRMRFAPTKFTKISTLCCYANRLNFSAMMALNTSFISSGKKERSINSNHFSFVFTNLLKIFPITFSSKPDACIEATKSAFLILRFLPLRVSANSSKGMS